MRVVAARAGDHRLARNRGLHRLHELDLLGVRQGWRLAGRAGDDDAVGAVLDQHRRELGRAAVVDRAVLLQRGDHRGKKAADLCHALTAPIAPMEIASSAIWTAFSAAPLRRLSDTIHSKRPCRVDASSRMRPTYTSSFPATPLGVG